MEFLQKIKDMLGMAPSTEPVPSPKENPAQPEEAPNPAVYSPRPGPVATGLPPAAALRTELTRFMVEKLRQYQNESDVALAGLRLLIVCADTEQQALYRIALWDGQPGKFRDELARQLADHYINLPANWQFTHAFFAEGLPDCTYRQGDLGLVLLDADTPTGPARLATLQPLTGQTEQLSYRLDPAQQTNFCIGRGHSAEAPSGRVRTNQVAFLNDDDLGFDAERGAANSAVSRFHATIQYNPARRQYYLKADQGGLPASGNKTKILRSDDTAERVDVAGMLYPLQHDDQIELGGAAKLLFTLD